MSQAADILAYVAAHPGATQRQIRLAHPAARNVGIPLAALRRAGRIGYVLIESGRAGQRLCRAYYAREHCPPGATLQPLALPAARRAAAAKPGRPTDLIGHARPASYLAKSRRTIRGENSLNAGKAPAGEPVITARTKVTVWQPRPDPRDAAIGPPPAEFAVRFADLGPGRYLARDTAVARAYGSRT